MRLLFVCLVCYACFVLACYALQETKIHSHTTLKAVHHKHDKDNKHNKHEKHSHRTVLDKVNTNVKGVLSPIGDQYVGGQKAADNDVVYTSDPLATILQSVTQFDENPNTRTDDIRCGAADIFVAAFISNKIDPLISFVLTTPSKPGRPLPTAADVSQLNRIKTSCSHRTVTYRDVGLLQDIIFRYWSVPSGTGMVGGELYRLMVNGIGISPPNTDGMFACKCFHNDQGIDFTGGQSWPFIIHLDGGSDEPQTIHWILIGRLPDTAAAPGSLFIYDPYTTSTGEGMFIEGTANYNAYQTWIWNSALPGSGWAPNNDAAANDDVATEDF